MIDDHIDTPEDPSLPHGRERLVIDLAAQVRAAWDALCAARGEKPGPAARRLIEAALSGQAAAGVREAPFGVIASPDERKKVLRKVYLTPSEEAAVTKVATETGFGSSEWIVAAVRAALTRSPSFGQRELEALTLSNVLLGEIAADLAAHEKGESDPAMSFELADLRAKVREHMRLASELMAEGVRRWEIKV